MFRIATFAALVGLTLLGAQTPANAAAFDANRLAPVAGVAAISVDGVQLAQAPKQTRGTPRKVGNANPVRNPCQPNAKIRTHQWQPPIGSKWRTRPQNGC